MKIPTGAPIGLVAKITGPRGFREIDMILDTGAPYTTISWDVARDIGYDPAIAEKRAHINNNCQWSGRSPLNSCTKYLFRGTQVR